MLQCNKIDNFLNHYTGLAKSYALTQNGLAMIQVDSPLFPLGKLSQTGVQAAHKMHQYLI